MIDRYAFGYDYTEEGYGAQGIYAFEDGSYVDYQDHIEEMHWMFNQLEEMTRKFYLATEQNYCTICGDILKDGGRPCIPEAADAKFSDEDAEDDTDPCIECGLPHGAFGCIACDDDCEHVRKAEGR